MNKSRDGILLIDKNDGETSFAVVRRVRETLDLKKVGHAGTLDPFATGLLLILLGQGTKLFPFLLAERKTYLATMQLGVETDTQDRTGRILQRSPVAGFGQGEIEHTARSFVGEIEQRPPRFSALKIKGRRAYELARMGAEPEMAKRRITIHALSILSVDLPEVTMEVTCSSGTYIRTLAADLGRRLGTGAHLKALRRTASGAFEVGRAMDSKGFGAADSGAALQERIIPLRDGLPHIRDVPVDAGLASRIRQGYRPSWREALRDTPIPDSFEGLIKLVSGRDLVAVASLRARPGAEGARIEAVRVFNPIQGS